MIPRRLRNGRSRGTAGDSGAVPAALDGPPGDSEAARTFFLPAATMRRGIKYRPAISRVLTTNME